MIIVVPDLTPLIFLTVYAIATDQMPLLHKLDTLVVIHHSVLNAFLTNHSD